MRGKRRKVGNDGRNGESPGFAVYVRNEEEANPIAISCGPTVDISMDRMKVKQKPPEGRAEYGKRKSVVEPVFGIIKEVLKLRQFLLRGMKKAKGEWTLACMAYNLKRMHIMQTS